MTKLERFALMVLVGGMIAGTGVARLLDGRPLLGALLFGTGAVIVCLAAHLHRGARLVVGDSDSTVLDK